jgi:hypothetical protein
VADFGRMKRGGSDSRCERMQAETKDSIPFLPGIARTLMIYFTRYLIYDTCWVQL